MCNKIRIIMKKGKKRKAMLTWGLKEKIEKKQKYNEKERPK